jgi:hypothetical protein
LRPKGTRTEEVQKKSVDPNEDKVGDKPDEPVVERGAGEGSHSPSSQRIAQFSQRTYPYMRLDPQASRRTARVIVGGVVIWEVGKWIVAIGGAVETGGASLAVLAAP